jgi:hypothetical protein
MASNSKRSLLISGSLQDVEAQRDERVNEIVQHLGRRMEASVEVEAPGA